MITNGRLVDLLARVRALRSQLEYRAAWRLASDAVPALADSAEANPQLAAEAHLLIGQLAEDLGDPVAAEASYAAAEGIAGFAPTPAGHTLRVFALVKLAPVLRDRGALGEADAALSKALVMAEVHLADGLEHADVLAEHSRQWLDKGAHDQAELLARRAVAMTEAAGPSDAREETRVRSLGALGTVLRVRGRYIEAHQVLEAAFNAAQETFGRESLEVAHALNDLGICDKFSGQFEEGTQHYRESLRIYEAAVGLDHPDVASLYHNLGGIMHAQRQFAAAEPWARGAVELREAVLGRDHLAVAADRAALASILAALGRDAEATELLQGALTSFEKTYGIDNHHEIAVYLNDLAAIARRRGDLEEAERLYRRALALKERLLGPAHAELAITLNNLAVVCRRQGLLAEAEQLYRRAISILSRAVEATHPALVASRRNLDRLLDETS